MGWLDSDRLNSYTITQHDWDGTLLGTLSGFITGSVTKEYYSDMRSIASINTVNDNYIDNALLKITINTNKGDSASLGTFCVANVTQEQADDGTIRKSYDLKSIIYKMQTNFFGSNYVLTGTCTFGSILDSISESGNYVMYNADSTVRGLTHEFSAEGAVYNAGTSVYAMFSDVCDQYGIRMCVDEHKVLFRRYVKPKDMTSAFTFSLHNGSVSGGFTIKPMKYDTPNDVIVTATSNDVTIYGRATIPAGEDMSPQNLKQWHSEAYSVSDINPATQARANEIAQSHLNKLCNPNEEIEHTGQFVGLEPDKGCVVTVECYNAKGVYGQYKALVKSMQTTLDASASTNYTEKVVNQNE